MNAGRIAFFLLAFGLVAAGCHAALSLDDLELVDSTTAPGGTGGMGGAGLSGGGGTGGSGGAGGAPCEVDNCPTDPTGCRLPICSAEGCDFQNEPRDKDCTLTGNPAAKVCDGDGNCVECNDATQCENPSEVECSGHQCIPLHCFNDLMDQGETGVDCGGTTGCPRCPNGQGCGVPDDCLSHYCDSGTCAACSDGDCAQNEWCNADNFAGTCEPDKIDGALCEVNDECTSDVCFTAGATNGVCCNELCWGGASDHCRSCFNADTDQADGLCAYIADGRDPFGHCPEGGVDCSDDACAGDGECQALTGGEACGTSTCAGEQVIVGACGSNGTCENTTNDCPDGLRCNGASGSCWPSCQNDGQCATGHWCHPSGVCPGVRNIGDFCVRDEQCQDGSDSAPHCVDGVCCNTDCTGLCRACDQRRTGQSNGVCSFVPSRTDPDEECDGGDDCCDGSAASCTAAPSNCDDYRCDGTTPATTGCSSPPCPGTCSGSYPAHSCDIDCAAGHCPSSDIVCPSGAHCDVNCGSTTANSCRGKTIICPPDHSCQVMCADGDESCVDTTVVCSADGICELNCGTGNACLGAEQICGAEECRQSCAGPVKPSVKCQGACLPSGGVCPSASCS